MTETLNRRDFLKLSALSLGALAVPGWLLLPRSTRDGAPGAPDPEELYPGKAMLGRVARRTITLYSQPDEASQRLAKIERDSLLELLDVVDSPYGPPHNPRWYRIDGGYVHSGYLQRVEGAHFNTPVPTVSEAGQLAEVTVPYTQALYQNKQGYTQKVYRLYYQSLHWVTGVMEGPDQVPWYSLTDEWLRVQYRVRGEHLRLVPPDELALISPEVPPEEKRIQVSIEAQTMTAFEAGRAVLHTSVATGLKYMETPTGDFFINRKTPSKHMGNGGLTDDPNAYELVGVPWVSFFHTNGSAFHGTYWHDNFGTPMSHGCVNMRTAEARWLYRWCMPPFDPQIDDAGKNSQGSTRLGWRVKGKGTAVRVE